MKTLLLMLLVYSAATAQANEHGHEPEQTPLHKIVIEGLTKTDPEVVRQELELTSGTSVTTAQVEAAVARVRNTRLFSKVTYTFVDGVLTVTAKDRWTTIPIAKFASGGGVSQFILGVYDPNIAGKNLEAGGQYERLGETNSGVIWFRNPRLFGERLSLFVQAWRINRLRTKYEQERVQPEEKTGFLQTREKYYLSLEYQWFDGLTTGLLVERNHDEFSDRYIDGELKDKVAQTGLPPDTQAVIYGGLIRAGQVNVLQDLLSGWQAEYKYSHARLADGLKDFDQNDLRLEWFYIGPWQINLAQRLLAGASNTETIQYWYYLGGLDRVRGFADNRFAGRYFWLVNSEVRIPSFRHDAFVIHNVLFYDVVSVGDSESELKDTTAASVGTGLRFIAPQIYRFVARLDVAVPILKDDSESISFGVQQFF